MKRQPPGWEKILAKKKKKATDKGLIFKRKILNFKNVKHHVKIFGSLRHFGHNSDMIYNV